MLRAEHSRLNNICPSPTLPFTTPCASVPTHGGTTLAVPSGISRWACIPTLKAPTSLSLLLLLICRPSAESPDAVQRSSICPPISKYLGRLTASSYGTMQVRRLAVLVSPSLGMYVFCTAPAMVFQHCIWFIGRHACWFPQITRLVRADADGMSGRWKVGGPLGIPACCRPVLVDDLALL